MESEEMDTFWFFRLRYRQAYNSAYDFDFRISRDRKHSYDSDYDEKVNFFSLNRDFFY